MGIAIAAAVIGGVWLTMRLVERRNSTREPRSDDGWAAASWLPAWFILGGIAGHDTHPGADAAHHLGDPGMGADLGGVDFSGGAGFDAAGFGGSGDFGGGGGGDFGSGGV